MGNSQRNRLGGKPVEEIRRILRRQPRLGIIRSRILVGGSNGIFGGMSRFDKLDLAEVAIIGQIEHQGNYANKENQASQLDTPPTLGLPNSSFIANLVPDKLSFVQG
jgi:hypothetical protein